MQKLVWQNANGDSIDLTSGNYGITQWEGFSNTSLNIQSQQVPFQDGAVFLDALLNQRELSVTLKMQDNGNLEERYRMRRELIHILNPKLGEGYLIYTNDFISKRIKCIAQIPLFETHNSNDSGTPSASLAWTACEPYWEDLDETEIYITAGETVVINNEGDVVSGFECDLLNNNVTNPCLVKLNTQEQLQIEGTFTKNIKINSNVGKKTIQECEKISIVSINKNTIRDVIYWKKSIVAVGFNGFIASYSIESNRWILHDTDISVNLNAVCYSEALDLLCIIGDSGKIYTSSNLTDWTERTSNTSNDLEDIIYNDIKESFVIAGYQVVLTSVDGINWNTVSVTTNYFPHKIAFSSIDGTTVISNRGNPLYSQDLVTWNEGSIPTTLSLDFTGLIFLRYYNCFYMTGGFSDGTSNLTLKSSNGINWTVVQDGILSIINNPLSDIAFSELNKTLALSRKRGELYKNNGEDIFYKVNTNIIIPSALQLIYIQEYGSWFILTDDGGIYKSSDLENWSILLQNTSMFDKVCCSDSIYVGITSGTDYIAYSNDGIEWNYIQLSQSYNMSTLKYIRTVKKFFITANYGTLLISDDGVHWIEKKISNYYLCGIAYSTRLKKYVVATLVNSQKIFVSSDLENWETIEIEDLANVNDLIYSERLNLFIAVSNNYIATSSDIENWTFKTNRSGTSITESEYFKCFFVVYQRYIYYSFNAIDWIQATNTEEYMILSRVYADNYENKIYAVGNRGVYEGIDIFSWVKINNSLSRDVVSRKGDVVFTGGNILRLIKKLPSNNLINALSKDSSFFVLDEGKNTLLLSFDVGTASAIIKYRQKYIGV